MAEKFTRKGFEVEKFTGHGRFAWFCHLQGQKWDQISWILIFEVKFGPILFSLICLKFRSGWTLRSRNPLFISDLHDFAIFRVKIGIKCRILDFLKSNLVRKLRPLTLFFYPNMAKSCKSDLISGFLDLKVHPGENFRQIRDKKFGPNLTSKVKIHDLWSHFCPWKWRNHVNLT